MSVFAKVFRSEVFGCVLGHVTEDADELAVEFVFRPDNVERYRALGLGYMEQRIVLSEEANYVIACERLGQFTDEMIDQMSPGLCEVLDSALSATDEALSEEEE